MYLYLDVITFLWFQRMSNFSLARVKTFHISSLHHAPQSPLEYLSSKRKFILFASIFIISFYKLCHISLHMGSTLSKFSIISCLASNCHFYLCFFRQNCENFFWTNFIPHYSSYSPLTFSCSSYAFLPN